MKTFDFRKLFVLMALGAPAAFAAEPSVPAVEPPTTRPAAPDINALITKLGAEDFKTREAATDELRKVGQAALPSLKEATRSFDPEVQTRAQMLIKDIENAAKPKATENNEVDFGPGGFGNAHGQVRIMINGQAVNVGGGNFRMSKTVTVVNSRKEIEVTENQQTVRITEGADGITMSVTETVDGKEATRKYQAKNAAELKEKQPEAYKIYEKNTREDPALRVRPVRPIRPGVRVAPKLVDPADIDDIRIEIPPDMLRNMPPEIQRQFAPKADGPATRPAKAE